MATFKGAKKCFTNHLDTLYRNVLHFIQRHSSAKPFLKPVDYVAFNIPDYPEKIKIFMDFSTVNERLRLKYYESFNNCLDDVFLIFKNCYIYNSPDDDIIQKALNLESYFKSKIASICGPEIRLNKSVVHSGIPVVRKKVIAKKRTVVVDSRVIRGKKITKEIESAVPATETVMQQATVTAKEENTYMNSSPSAASSSSTDHSVVNECLPHFNPELDECLRLVNELMSSSYNTSNYLFLQPVDSKSLGLHDYDTKVRHPVDLSSIRANLEVGYYPDRETVVNEIYLMLNNCYNYNGISTDIGLVCHRFQDDFEALHLRMFQKKSQESVYNEAVYFLARAMRRHRELEEMIRSNSERISLSKQKLDSIVEMIESKSDDVQRHRLKEVTKRKISKVSMDPTSPKSQSRYLNKKPKFTKSSVFYE